MLDRIDILLRVNAEESHGTAPLDWDIRPSWR